MIMKKSEVQKLFGQALYMQWYFNHVFLNEGFTDYMKWKKANMAFECIMRDRLNEK